MKTLITLFVLLFAQILSNGESLPEWKKYDKKEGVIMEIDKQTAQRNGMYKKKFDLLEWLL